MFKSLLVGEGLFSQYVDFEEVNWERIQEATQETLLMTAISLAGVFIVGLVIGLLLYETAGKKSVFAKVLHFIVSVFVNIFRSVPFIILIVLLIPFTKQLVGSIIGPVAALPALIISSAPFYGRLVETGFREIDKGVIEAAEAMGRSEEHTSELQ